MSWPHVLNVLATCPECGTRRDIEAICFISESRRRGRTNIQAITWATCAICKHEWRLTASLFYRPAVA
jgi:hypothetical protein